MKTGARVKWFSTERAAEHLDFPSAKAFRAFIDRLPKEKQPKRHYVGREMRFREVDLDALVEPEAVDAAPALRLVSKGGGR